MSTGKVKLTALALTVIASGALAKARPAAKVADSGATQLKREPATEQRPALIVIAPGIFTMGSPASETERNRSETQHEVQIQTRFAISVTEVTQGQYKKVMQTNPSEFSGDLNRPVERVTFFDAVDYCNRLSKKEKLTPCYHRSEETVTWPEGLRCTGYRLPTEAEWEYAARAGTKAKYAGSDTLEEVGWWLDNSKSTSPVAKKRANAWGLYDMSGNVWEWVWDWHVTAYDKLPSVDPIGPESGKYRIIRGGSWSHTDRLARVAYRVEDNPDRRGNNQGFRVARSTP